MTNKLKFYIKARVRINCIKSIAIIEYGKSQLFTKPYSNFQKTNFLKQAVNNAIKNYKNLSFQLLDYEILPFIKCDKCNNECIYIDSENNLCESCLIKYQKQEKLYNHIKTNEI